MPAAAIEYLRRLDRLDLARLLDRYCGLQYQQAKTDWGAEDVVVILSPPLFSEALRGLTDNDKSKLKEAIEDAISRGQFECPMPDRIVFQEVGLIAVPDADTLLPETVIHMQQMVAVATNEVRIDKVNDHYRARHKRITAELERRGMEHANPYADLWSWHSTWKEQFPTYKSRRQFVRETYASILERLSRDDAPAILPREPTGWERVDRALKKARNALNTARNEEDFQSVGLLCRELMISVGQAVYDPVSHKSPDGVTIGPADGGRMIEAFLSTAMSGDVYAKTRKHVRAAIDLALELQHKRTADFRHAATCLEATASVAQIISIFTGRHDPGEPRR
jgi:hypothetical protein